MAAQRSRRSPVYCLLILILLGIFAFSSWKVGSYVLDALEQKRKYDALAQMLKDLGATKKALLVLPERDEMVVRAAQNIPGLKTAYVNTINVLDILNYDKFIVTEAAVKLVEEVYD